jgi:hypothetical protein
MSESKIAGVAAALPLPWRKIWLLLQFILSKIASQLDARKELNMKKFRTVLTVAGIAAFTLTLVYNTFGNPDISKKTGVKNCMKCHTKIPAKGEKTNFNLTPAGQAYKDKGTVPAN